MNQTRSRPVIFGEVLFDTFEDGERVLGGAPFNVSWHLQAFGLHPLYISRIGNDPLGNEIQQTIQTWKMDSSGIQEDPTHPTGIVQVDLQNQQPTYQIKENSAYDHIDANKLPPIPANGLLYHGTLALRQPESREALRTLKKSSQLPIFVDINLRAPWWTRDLVEESLQDAHWLKLNADELCALAPDLTDESQQLSWLFDRFDLACVIVTYGEKGASAFTQDRQQITVTPATETKSVDSVGAGDAFVSVLILGKSLGWTLELSLERAQEFASAIVGIRGATSRDLSLYAPFIQSWDLECTKKSLTRS